MAIEKFDSLYPYPRTAKRPIKAKLLTALGGAPYPQDRERDLERKILQQPKPF